MRDLLSEIRSGALGPDEADAIADDILRSPGAPHIVERLGLSKKEYTAFVHGVPFHVIARWRYDGWPSECARCQGPIDSDQYWWMAREGAPGIFVLEHISCP